MEQTTMLKEKLEYVRQVLTTAEQYDHAVNVLMYDQETICPIEGMEEQGDVMAFLSNQSYKLIKEPAFIEAAEYLYEHRDELDEFDRAMAEQLHRGYLQTKNVTPELQHEFSLVYNRAFVNWSKAREAADYSLFAPSLHEVTDVNHRMIELRGADAAGNTPYDALIDEYERGMTSDVLDEAFGACKERLLPLLEKIKKSPKKIRSTRSARPRWPNGSCTRCALTLTAARLQLRSIPSRRALDAMTPVSRPTIIRISSWPACIPSSTRVDMLCLIRTSRQRTTTISLLAAKQWACTSLSPASTRTGSAVPRALRTLYIPRPANCSRMPWKASLKESSTRDSTS